MVIDEEILRKLDQLESRLSKLENNGTNEKKIIKEDRIEIAEEGRLESSEISKENGMVKIKRVPVCDHCGHQLTTFSICKRCNHKLDEKCSIEFRKRVFCPDCLQVTNPITRPAFKVLLCYANSIVGNSDVHEMTGISKREVKDIVQFLLGVGYLESSVFHGNSMSEKGREVLSAYSQLWGGTGDMQQLDEEIKRFVLQQ